MSDVNTQIRDRIETFVQELGELVRRAALESVSSALGAGLGARAARGRAGVAVAAQARPAAPAAAAAAGRGGKRSAEELESTTQSVLDYIEANPGQGVEQIARDLNLSSKELVLPIRKLLSARKITTEGQKRATKYFLSGRGGDDSQRGRGGRSSKRGAKKAGRRRK